MNNSPSALINKLANLAQLDVDASQAYQIAIDKIDVAQIKEKLTLFKGDHERHIKELNQFIAELGGNPVKHTLDLKGILIEGMTLLRSAMGTESALKAMRTNEKTTNQTYDEALSENSLPENIRKVLEKNRDDERKHLQYVENCLENFKERSY